MRITSTQRNAMQSIPPFDPTARKRPANLSVNGDLLRRAKASGLNLSQLLEERLIEKLRELERESWLGANKEAVEDYNRRVSEHGVFSNGLRRF